MAMYVIAAIPAFLFAHMAGKTRLRGGEGGLARAGGAYIKSAPGHSGEGLFLLLLALSFLPLFAVSGLRWNVGTDFASVYVHGFYMIKSGMGVTWEPGYVLLNRLALLFTGDPAGIMLLSSFVFLFFTYRAICDSSVDIGLSVLFAVLTGFYFYSMNGIRQWIALSVFLYSIKYIREARFFRYMFWIAAASTVHFSALIFIPVYFLCRIRIPPKAGALIVAASVAALPVVRPIFEFIVSRTVYARYLDSVYNRFDFSLADFIIGLALLIFGYLYYGRAKDDKNYVILINLQLAAFITAMYSWVIFLAERLVPCFTASQLLLVPLLLSKEKDAKTRRLLTAAVICAFAAAAAYTFGVIGWAGVTPYRSIFSRGMLPG